MPEKDSTGSSGGYDELEELARRQLVELGFNERCLGCEVALSVARVLAVGKLIVRDPDMEGVASGELEIEGVPTSDEEQVRGLLDQTRHLGADVTRLGLRELLKMRSCHGWLLSTEVDASPDVLPEKQCGVTGRPYEGLPEVPEE